MNEQLTGAQLKAQSTEYEKLVRQISTQMGLRKWAVEQAVKIFSITPAPFTNKLVEEIVEIFYGFVTKLD